jgi:hypothetical protein
MGKRQQGFKSDVINSKKETLGKLFQQLGGPDMVLVSKTSSKGKPMLFGNGTVSIKTGGAIYKFSASLSCTVIDSEKSPLPAGAREAVAELGDVTLKDLGLDKVMVSPREFGSGKVGFYHGDKVSLKVGDLQLRCQVGCSIVAWHSDTWAEERPAQPEKKSKDQATA